MRLTSTAREHSQGELHNTGNQLDVAIQGKGFLPVTMPNGTTQYTRNGALQMTAEGKLVTSDGYAVGGDITIPPDAQSVTIAADGTVTATDRDGCHAPTTLGQIQLANVREPGRPRSAGRQLVSRDLGLGHRGARQPR